MKSTRWNVGFKRQPPWRPNCETGFCIWRHHNIFDFNWLLISNWQSDEDGGGGWGGQIAGGKKKRRGLSYFYWTNIRLHFHERVPTKYSKFHYVEVEEERNKRKRHPWWMRWSWRRVWPFFCCQSGRNGSALSVHKLHKDAGPNDTKSNSQ